jgi:hypothetical protein
VALNMITLINVFTVELANQQRLIDLLVRVTDEFVRQSPGLSRRRFIAVSMAQK